MYTNGFKILILLLLLTNYVGQTYANATMDCSKHSNMSQIDTSHHDHAMHQSDTTGVTMSHDSSGHDCCETSCHCAVSSCSSVNILISHLVEHSVIPTNRTIFEFGESSPVTSIVIVYRPPILA